MFTLLPSVSQGVQSLLTTSDLSQLTSVMGPYVNGTNLKGVFPTEFEFYALAMKVSQLISSLDWTRAHPVDANRLVRLLLLGLATRAEWPSPNQTLDRPIYRQCLAAGYTMYTALVSCGVLDGSIPSRPVVGRKEEVSTPAPVSTPVVKSTMKFTPKTSTTAASRAAAATVAAAKKRKEEAAASSAASAATSDSAASSTTEATSPLKTLQSYIVNPSVTLTLDDVIRLEPNPLDRMYSKK